MILMFMNGSSLGVCLLIMLSAVALFYSRTAFEKGVEKAVEVGFYGALVIALGALVYNLSDLTQLEQLGTGVSFSLLLVFYGAVIRVVVNVGVRFWRGRS